MGMLKDQAETFPERFRLQNKRIHRIPVLHHFPERLAFLLPFSIFHGVENHFVIRLLTFLIGQAAQTFQNSIQMIRIDGLQQIINYVQLNGAARILEDPITGNQDKKCIRKYLSDFFHNFQTIIDRHLNICQYKVRMMLQYALTCFLAIVAFIDNLNSQFIEPAKLLDQLDQHIFIIRDDHTVAHALSPQ